MFLPKCYKIRFDYRDSAGKWVSLIGTWIPDEHLAPGGLWEHVHIFRDNESSLSGPLCQFFTLAKSQVESIKLYVL